MPEEISIGLLRELAGQDELNMIMLAMNLSRYINGVATRHGQISQNMFPGFEIHATTDRRAHV